MEIGDVVRYIGGQDKKGKKLFNLGSKEFYIVDKIQPEYYKDLGLCQSIGFIEYKGMFRVDLFVVIPIMKEQVQRKHKNF